MIRASAKWLRRAIKLILLTALLLVAAYASLGRYYIGYVEKYQQVLVEGFVSYTGLPVEVAGISASWSKLSFILSFNDIKLHGENDKVLLAIPQANFKVNPLESLWHQRFLVDSVSVDGFSTRFEEVLPGKWRLAGFDYQADDSDEALDIDQLLDFILDIDSLEFFNSRIDLQYHNDEVSALTSGEVFLRHDDGFRRIRLQANLQDTEGNDTKANGGDEPIDFLIESLGDPRDIEFSAKAYLKFDDVDLVDQLPVLHSFGIRPEEIKIDSTMWLEWKPGRVISLQGEVTTPLIDLGGISGHDIPAIKDLSFAFRFERNPENEWQLWLPNIKGNWKGQLIDFKQSLLTLKGNDVAVNVAAIDVGRVSHTLANLNILPPKANDALRALAPSGELENIKLKLHRKAGDDQSYQLSNHFDLAAELKNINVSSWHGAPEVRNISGYIQLDEAAGEVLLSAEQFELGFSGIYDKAMNFDVAKARVAWQYNSERVLVDSGVIDLRADHGPVVGQLALDIPLRGQYAPTMFLAVGLNDTQASYRNKFIPTLLSDELLSWLDNSIKGGVITQGGFIFNGSLAKGDGGDRTVQVYLDVEDVALDYQPGWPALSAIKAGIMVDDASVDVQSSTALANHITVENTRVTVSPLPDSGSWLTVDTVLDGSAKHGLEVVNSGNLRELLGDGFSNWQLEGHMHASLALGLPLANGHHPSVIDFKSYLRAGYLTLPDYRLSLSDFYGPLNYSSKLGVSSDGLQGLLFDKKTTVKLSSAVDKSVTVNVDSKISMKDVADWTQFPGMVFFNGETQLNAELLVNSPRSHLSIKSDLQGVDIDLPAPFQKTKDQSASFAITMPLTESRPVMRLSLDEILTAHLQFDKNSLSAGHVVFNPEGYEKIIDNEFIISGELDQVAVDDIEKTIKRYLAKSKEMDATTTKPSGSSVPQQSAALRVTDLRLTNTHVLGMDIDSVIIGLESNSRVWDLNFSSDALTGELLFPIKDDQLIEMNLQSVYFYSEADKKRNEAVDENLATELYQLKASVFDNVKPEDIQPIDVTVQQIYLDDVLLGSVDFGLRVNEDTISLNDIEGEIRGLELGKGDKDLQLSWQGNDRGGESHIKGTINFTDVGAVFEQWGYERVTESEFGQIDLDLTWPGAPDQWQMVLSQGRISLDIENGVFLKTGEGSTGALRVVSVLNMSNILRRLRLDFTDVYKSGLSFDEVKGEFEIVGGRLYIVEHLNIESPSSRFRVLGSTDLNAEVLDMDLIVTLPIGKNLPWIAALMGGVPAAAVVYGASKIFASQVDSFSSAVYSLNGKWDNPEMVLQKVFDGRGKDREKRSSENTSDNMAPRIVEKAQ